MSKVLAALLALSLFVATVATVDTAAAGEDKKEEKKEEKKK
jgi:hypothetical protein